MQTAPHNRDVTTASYLVGFALALALTAIPFALVAAQALPPGQTLAAIAVAAVAQIFVHLRFFLHLTFRRDSRDALLTLCFTAILIVLMAGGSLWIMFDLHGRMTGG